jgi:hypothetical protein
MTCQSKVCTSCQADMPLVNFYSSKTGKYGVMSRCKECEKRKKKEGYAAHPEKYREKNKINYSKHSSDRRKYKSEYYKSNREEIVQKQRAYYQKNKDKLTVKMREYYSANKLAIRASARDARKANPEEFRRRKRDWCRNNPDKVRAMNSRWNSENQEYIKQYRKIYYAKNKSRISDRGAEYRRKNADAIRARSRVKWQRRWHGDQVFRARKLVSGSIYKSLKSRGVSKGGESVFRFLGYTRDELYSHLISTLPPGYAESDFAEGKLHIDHITPHSAFPYTSMDCELFRMCWSLENLRLIPAGQNIRKSNLIEHKTKRGVVYYKCMFAPSKENQK